MKANTMKANTMEANTMKAIQVTRSGGPEVLQLIDQPTPTPGPGQILIEVKAAGINFADLMAREGHYPPAPPPPFVLGVEAAGIVTAVGEGVTNFKSGDRAAAIISTGGYAEYALADAATAAPVPEALGFPEVSALLVQGLTAHGLLSLAVPEIKGKTVLISAAAGGVGSLAVQIAKLLGAGTVIGLASTDEKRAKVKELGADFAVDYTQEGWAEQVRAITDGKGADVFLDASGDNKGGGVKPLARGGYWIVYGAQSSSETGLSGSDLLSMLFNAQTLRGWSLYGVPTATIAATLKQLIAWTLSGELTIIAKDKFALADAAEAHRAIETRRTTGKVVLEP